MLGSNLCLSNAVVIRIAFLPWKLDIRLKKMRFPDDQVSQPPSIALILDVNYLPFELSPGGAESCSFYHNVHL